MKCSVNSDWERAKPRDVTVSQSTTTNHMSNSTAATVLLPRRGVNGKWVLTWVTFELLICLSFTRWGSYAVGVDRNTLFLFLNSGAFIGITEQRCALKCLHFRYQGRLLFHLTGCKRCHACVKTHARKKSTCKLVTHVILTSPCRLCVCVCVCAPVCLTDWPAQLHYGKTRCFIQPSAPLHYKARAPKRAICF